MSITKLHAIFAEEIKGAYSKLLWIPLLIKKPNIIKQLNPYQKL